MFIRPPMMTGTKDTITIKVDCSKGTYIRSLCEDIAEKLGTIGTMSKLQRTKTGEFKIENSYTLEQIENIVEVHDCIHDATDPIITIEELYKKSESITLNEIELLKFLNGMEISVEAGIFKDISLRIYNKNNQFIGLADYDNRKIKRKLVILP